jgi:8-oxo-dGTP pyrophosphatase MutT (NUDIX family)
MKNQKPWKTVSAEHIVDTPHFRLRRDTVKLPTGEVFSYYINESRGWVGIFCVTARGKVILNRQYKHGIGKYVLELPAGALEPGESPLDCAKRELLEESGYVAEKHELIRSFVIDPSASAGIMHLVYCENARRQGPKKVDPTERIRNRQVTLHELIGAVRAGRIDVLGHVAAIYTILDKKGLLKAKASLGANTGGGGRRKRAERGT